MTVLETEPFGLTGLYVPLFGWSNVPVSDPAGPPGQWALSTLAEGVASHHTHHKLAQALMNLH